jgi:hypothetical protein
VTVAVSTLDSLYELAQCLLTAAADALDETDAGTPGRQVVYYGTPTLDCCGELAVWVQSLQQGTTAPLLPPLQPGHRVFDGSRNLPALHLLATRCVPTPDSRGNPPAADAITAAAKTVITDGWALWNGIQKRIRAKNLFPGGGCSEYFMDGLQAIAPSGGCAGWQMVIRFAIDGIPDDQWS